MGNSGSNKALPSAIPATDILEMIGGQAVIQYNVMPDAATEGMIIQYIGESDATYTSGSWYRGENSEWVLVSSSGGVYVGTGNMPDGYNVQIDPSGDVFDPDNYALKNHGHDGVYQPVGDYAAPSVAKSVTLAASGWTGSEAPFTQTVNVTGATATNVKVVSPAYASVDEYAACGVKAAAEGAGTITFACTTVPENDLTINIAILG